MIQITNKNKFPVQIIIRSKLRPNSFATVNIPGVGNGKNKKLIEDEEFTEYIKKEEKNGLISVEHI